MFSSLSSQEWAARRSRPSTASRQVSGALLALLEPADRRGGHLPDGFLSGFPRPGPSSMAGTPTRLLRAPWPCERCDALLHGTPLLRPQPEDCYGKFAPSPYWPPTCMAAGAVAFGDQPGSSTCPLCGALARRPSAPMPASARSPAAVYSAFELGHVGVHRQPEAACVRTTTARGAIGEPCRARNVCYPDPMLPPGANAFIDGEQGFKPSHVSVQRRPIAPQRRCPRAARTAGGMAPGRWS